MNGKQNAKQLYDQMVELTSALHNNRPDTEIARIKEQMKHKVSKEDLAKELSDIKVKIAKVGVICSIATVIMTAIIVKALS